MLNSTPHDQPASDLPANLAAPAQRALAVAGITTLEQLARLSEAEVKQLHGIGPNAFVQLSRALAEAGLSFASAQPAQQPASKHTFTTTVLKDDKVNATGLPVPAEVVAALGTKKRPAVKVTLRGYTYRSTVAAYDDVFMLPLSAEHRNAAGVQAGDQVEITLEPDGEPRSVEVPPDLAASLDAKPGAREAFDALSYTLRKEYVRQVETAKALETRQRRIAKIVETLG
jgi:hypothetical protein